MITRQARVDSPRPARRALTLVEMVTSIVLVGVMLVAAVNTVGASKLGQRKQYDRRQGYALARLLLAEIRQLPYADPLQLDYLRTRIFADGLTANYWLGPELDELIGLRRAFDDIDDYNGWTDSPPQARDGTAMTELSGWSRSVTVVFLSAADRKTIVTQDEGVKRISVSVAHSGAAVVELVALCSLDRPPAEACCFPDGTAVDLLPARCLALGGTPGGPGSSTLNTSCSASSLVAHWRMDENGGTTTVDDVSGFTATLIDGANWIKGRNGSGLKFDGSNDYAEVPHDERLSITGELTIAAWIYKLSNTNWDVALSKGTVDPHHNYNLATNGSRIVFEFHDGVQYWHSTSSFTLGTKKWYHIAVTYHDASDTVKIYRDGQLVDTITCTGSLLRNNDPLRFGECTSNCCMWHGYLDDVYIYSRVLTADEVLLLYQGGEPK